MSERGSATGWRGREKLLVTVEHGTGTENVTETESPADGHVAERGNEKKREGPEGINSEYSTFMSKQLIFTTVEGNE